MNIQSLAKLAIMGKVACRWCGKAPATWFDVDKRDASGYVAICDACYQDPKIARSYAIHVVNGEAVLVLRNGHGGKNERVRVSKGTLSRIEAIKEGEGKPTNDAAISHALDVHDEHEANK